MVAKTQNGAKAYSSTESAVLDAFFQIVRGISVGQLHSLLSTAWQESPEDTLRLIFQTRDCRGGKGERTVFREALKWLAFNHPKHLLYNMEHIPEFGRWDDLLALFDNANDEVCTKAIALFASQLEKDQKLLEAQNQEESKEEMKKEENQERISLAAKWAPSEHGSQDKTKGVVKLLCKQLGINKATYRKKYIAPLREHLQIVEKYMCEKDYSKIDYERVPSLAMMKHRKAFLKNDAVAYEKYLKALEKGEAKINASVVDPYQIVQTYMKSRTAEVDRTLEAQWKEIVKRVKEMGSFDRAICMSDVSGSMGGDEAMPVSIAMGMLISEVSKHFRGQVISFDSNPTWFSSLPDATVRERVTAMLKGPWGGTTNFNRAIQMILEHGIKNKIPQDEMPNRLFVISDMQFNSAGRLTNMDALKQQYADAGYDLPTIIFWNVRASTTAPTTSSEKNVALLSGYSPSLMKAVIDGEDFSPLAILRNILDDARYSIIKLDPSVVDQNMKDDDDEEEEEDEDA